MKSNSLAKYQGKKQTPAHQTGNGRTINTCNKRTTGWQTTLGSLSQPRNLAMACR